MTQETVFAKKMYRYFIFKVREGRHYWGLPRVYRGDGHNAVRQERRTQGNVKTFVLKKILFRIKIQIILKVQKKQPTKKYNQLMK